MIADIERDMLIFSCGHSVSANKCIVGISPLGKTYDGYDGLFDRDINNTPLTAEQKIELADYMIALWTKYKGW